jgi:hypothetical protein
MKRTEHRPRSEAAFDRPGPELAAYGGIVSGYLTSYAAAWETTPAAVLDAIERSGLTPIVDTAEPADNRETHTRPSDPGWRCLAFRADDVERLQGALDATPRG